MANVNKTEDKVFIKLFKDNDKYKDDVFVCINGKRFLIKRGIEVEVPVYVKLALDDAARQQNDAANFMMSVINKQEG